MNRLKTIFFCILIFGAFVCCHNNKDAKYFNGEIRQIDKTRKITKHVTSTPLPIHGRSYGEMAVYDSLMIFWNPKLPDFFFNVFNIDTGEETGSFFSRGRGPGESISVSPISQFYKKGDDLMALLEATNENQLFFWNISQSLTEGITVFDSIVPYESKNRDGSSRYFYMFRHSEDQLFASVSTVYLSDTKITPPAYEKRTIHSDELQADYPIYKISELENKKSELIRFNYFYSFDAIKPDGSKIVQAMSNLPQINIIDTQMGEIIGYRIQKSPGFSLFETDMKPLNKYYNSVQVDDNYIYATYWGKEHWTSGDIAPDIRTIHIYDWEGNQVYELITDRVFFRIYLDTVRNRLYTWDLTTGDAAYLDLNELDIKS
jgi:hypothetical protein